MKNIISAVLILFLACAPALADDAKPPKSSQSDKCPVCGMFVAKYKNWIACITYRDGTTVFFDGAKDMFRYYLDPGAYGSSKKTSDIAAIHVTEYYTAKPAPAEKMFYISGSDIYGPMGEELIPVETEKTAKEFMKDHKGKKILKFGGITAEDLK